jgi:hypothetical protein
VTVVPAPLGAFPASVAGSDRFGAYLFTITNNTSSSLNNVRFRAELTTGGEWVDSNPVQKDAAQCTRTTLTKIDCSVGYNGLIEKGGTVSFNILLKTPTSGIVTLAWDVRPGDGEALGFIASTEETALANDESTGENARVASVVPPTGFFIYTGVNNIPNANKNGDLFTSAANVYPVNGYTITAAITEGLPGATFPTIFGSNVCPPNARFCSNLSVDVQQPGLPVAKAKYPETLSDKLIITLRIDAEIVAGLNINTTPIFYTSDDGVYPSYQVLPCPSKRDSYLPKPGDPPCIHSRTVLGKKFGTDLAGDWQIEMFAPGNGMFAFD